MDNWDDVLWVAGSLKLGQITASELMKMLQAGKGNSVLAKAIAEIGRVAKTMYLLNYIDNAGYRRRIMIQLLRGDRRHSLARAVYHGHKGEVHKKYQDGLEDQLGKYKWLMHDFVRNPAQVFMRNDSQAPSRLSHQFPSWHPDGQEVFFESFADLMWSIWAIAINGNYLRVITPKDSLQSFRPYLGFMEAFLPLEP